MAEPKKETVRIALPQRPEEATATSNATKHDTARIVLPPRTPLAPLRRSPPKITPMPASDVSEATSVILPRHPPTIAPASSSALLQPLPKPPGIERENPPMSAAHLESSSVNRGPKKETARITILPKPAPAINMTKTQPLVMHPPAGTQPAPVIITSKPLAPLDTIPRPLCWALLGISAVIFLIQIWNYVVS